MSTAADGGLVADIVLEGGGVKGIALVGAISVLAERGYRFERVAGTSAGAIVGALIAADIKPTELHQRTPLYIGSKDDVDLTSRVLAGKSELVGA